MAYAPGAKFFGKPGVNYLLILAKNRHIFALLGNFSTLGRCQGLLVQQQLYSLSLKLNPGISVTPLFEPVLHF